MSGSSSGQRWAFIADWLDPNSGVRWTYQLFAHHAGAPTNAAIEVEMVSWKLLGRVSSCGEGSVGLLWGGCQIVSTATHRNSCRNLSSLQHPTTAWTITLHASTVYKACAGRAREHDGFTLLVQFDIKNRRHFLKRVKCDSVELSQLYVGSTVTVFARQLHLIAYGDEATRRAVEARAQR